MTTELELIYTLHDIVRGGKMNQDDPINERLMRSFLSAHRGKLLYKFYKDGRYISDVAFQECTDLVFEPFSDCVYVCNNVPKIIRFKDNAGFIATKNGYVISVVNSEEFETSQHNKFNKHHPLIKYIGGKMYLYSGMVQNCVTGQETESVLNTTVNGFATELLANGNIKISLKAVLVNTDDGVGYDFTTSPYPLDDEIIEDMMNSTLSRDFNLFLRMKSDEVSDGRNNNADFGTREEM